MECKKCKLYDNCEHKDYVNSAKFAYGECAMFQEIETPQDTILTRLNMMDAKIDELNDRIKRLKIENTDTYADELCERKS